MKVCCQVSTPEVFRKPGVTSYQGDLSAAFSTLSNWGFQGIELTVRAPKEVPVDLIKGLSADYDVEIPMICTGEYYGQEKLSFADPDTDIRDEAINRFKEGIDIAQEFDALINLGRVRGGMTPGMNAEVTKKRILEALLDVTDYAEKKNVTIVLEPVNTLALNYINTTQEGIELIKQVGSDHFQLMIDTAHLHIEDISIQDSLSEGKAFIKYVHLADSNRKYLGGGVFDFAAFIGLLKTIEYDGWLGVEVFPIPDQETAFYNSINLIKPMIM